MKTICIIPAKEKSRSIPKKNIIQFCGRPLVEWTILQAKQSNEFDEIIISTDSREIFEIAYWNNVNVIMRPQYLALDNTSTEEVILHVLDVIGSKDEDIITFLQVTSPLREKKDIPECLDLFLNRNYDSLFSMSILKDSGIWKRSQISRELVGALFDPMNRNIMRQERQKYFLENGSIYIFTTGNIRKHNNRLGGDIGMYEMPFWKSFEIDEPEDIELCEFYFKRKILK